MRNSNSIAALFIAADRPDGASRRNPLPGVCAAALTLLYGASSHSNYGSPWHMLSRRFWVVSCVALVALALSGCGGGGGGGGGSGSGSSSMLRPTEPTPTPQVAFARLREIAGNANTWRIPAVHTRATTSAQGMSETQRNDQIIHCTGTVCRDEEGETVLSLEDFFGAPGLDPNIRAVWRGIRTGLDTAIIVSEDDASFSGFLQSESFSGEQQVGELLQVSISVDSHTYGVWGEHGFAAVAHLFGPFRGSVLGVPFGGHLSSAFPYIFGRPSGTNPGGLGSAAWHGQAEARSVQTLSQRRTGTATLSIDDLSRPELDVDVRIDGRSIGSSAWTDIPLSRGEFRTGSHGSDYLDGSFFGPGHVEAYGVFDTSAYIGAFGVKRPIAATDRTTAAAHFAPVML